MFKSLFKFLNSGLNTSVSYLPEFKIYTNYFYYTDLLRSNGVFLYDYANCMEKLNEESLLPQKDFYNQLTDSEIWRMHEIFRTRSSVKH